MPNAGGVAVIVAFVVSIVVIAAVLIAVFIKERSASPGPIDYGPGPVTPPQKRYATILNWTQYIIEVVVSGVGYKINPGQSSSVPTGRTSYNANHSPHVMITSTDELWIIGSLRPIQSLGGLKTITNLSNAPVQLIQGIPSVDAQGPIMKLPSSITSTVYTGNGFNYQLNDSSGMALSTFSEIVGKKLYVTSDLKLTSSIISFINQNGSTINVVIAGVSTSVANRSRFTTINPMAGYAIIKDSAGNSMGTGVKFASNITQVVVTKNSYTTNDSNADVSGIPSSSIRTTLPVPNSNPNPPNPNRPPPTNQSNGQQPVIPPPHSGSQTQGVDAGATWSQW